jgi:outer membrane biosynthesis protein TonB
MIGLPPIAIDTTRPGLDVREMPSAELVASTERTFRIPADVAAGLLERRPVSNGYPLAARQRNESGYVQFRVIVSQDGIVQGLTVVKSSDQVFVPIATATVQSRQYRPYVLNGRAVAVDTMVRVDFSPGR